LIRVPEGSATALNVLKVVRENNDIAFFKNFVQIEIGKRKI
jgi:hypothetical protein